MTLRGLSNPETSRRGNYLGMAGMAIAVLTTLAVAVPDALKFLLILAGLAIGGGIGAVYRQRIPDDGDAAARRGFPQPRRGRQRCFVAAWRGALERTGRRYRLIGAIYTVSLIEMSIGGRDRCGDLHAAR